MNYTKLLYKIIGDRIKAKRLSTTLKNDFGCPVKATLDNIDIDNATLSNIQNGIAKKRKNPYLMNVGQMEYLSELFGMTIFELVWGNDEDQERFIKILLLAIMLNGEKYNNDLFNPFCHYESSLELFAWTQKLSVLPNDLCSATYCAIDNPSNETIYDNEGKTYTIEDLRAKVDDKLKTRLGSFYCKDNYKLYELLEPERDNKLLPISDALTKNLFHNYNFTVSFTERITNKIFNQDYSFISDISTCKQKDISNSCETLLLHPSRFILDVMDYKSHDYPLFTDAFNSMWERHKTKYMSFFQEKIFYNSSLKEEGLKYFQNYKFDEIIKSEEFYELVSSTSILESYTDPEAILSNNYFLLSVQATLQKNIIVNIPKYNSALFELTSDSANKIRKSADKILKKTMMP